jgi:VanZ family protein
LRIWVFWIPALLIMAGIAFLSHQSDLPDVPGGPPDWLLHAIEFGALAGACLYGATRGFHPHFRSRRAALLALLISVAYGAADELHQSFVPGRDVSLRDWTADSIGALIVVLALTLFWSRTGRHEESR